MADYTFFQAIADFSPCYKAGKKMQGIPEGILIHSTGAENPALSRWVNSPEIAGVNKYNNYFGGENNPDVTPHAVFGLTANGGYGICQILPYDWRCWGCGSGKNGSYNTTHIQIEIAEDYGKQRQYFDDMIDIVSDWCANLMLIYPIEYDCIVSHSEAAKAGYASNHGDPEHWFGKYDYTMDDFRALCAAKYKAKQKANVDNTVTAANPILTNYTVQVGAFSSWDNAKNYAADLQKRGIPAFVKRVT